LFVVLNYERIIIPPPRYAPKVVALKARHVVSLLSIITLF